MSGTVVNVPPNVDQIMIDFYNPFTGTFCEPFAIKLLLEIPPKPKRITTLSCKI